MKYIDKVGLMSECRRRECLKKLLVKEYTVVGESEIGLIELTRQAMNEERADSKE